MNDKSAPAPGSSPARRSSPPRPTRLAAVLLAGLAVVSAVLPIPVALVAVAAFVLAGCVLADFLRARQRTPALDRTVPDTIALGVPVAFHAIAEGLGEDRGARIRQSAPPALRLEPSSGPGTRLEAELTGVQRGTHVLGPVTVRACGPLGLASLDHTLGDDLKVAVFPDLPLARRLSEARRRGRTREDEGRIRARLGLGTDFETIRDYLPDDDIRQVNWTATSRVGHLMSNVYRVDENRELVCLVDTGRLMASPVGAFSRLDAALNAVAVLAVAAEEAGDRVGTVAFEAKVVRQLSPRRRGAEAVVRALFDLEPVEVESDYERAFFALGAQKRALVAVFTDLVDEGAARTLVSSLPVLARRHAVLVASCLDPDLDSVVSRAPAQVRDVMRAAAAVDLLRERRRVVSVLRGLGAVVAEAAPESLGTACVNAYLRMKLHARL